MKIIPLLTATLLLQGLLFAQTTVSIEADIRGRSCTGGLGICGVSGGGSTTQSKTTARTIDEHSFLLMIERDKITSQEEKSLAGKSFSELSKNAQQVFTMEEEIVLDNETAKVLGLEKGYNVIPKGTFPMTFDDKKIYITLTVEK